MGPLRSNAPCVREGIKVISSFPRRRHIRALFRKAVQSSLKNSTAFRKVAVLFNYLVTEYNYVSDIGLLPADLHKLLVSGKWCKKCQVRNITSSMDHVFKHMKRDYDTCRCVVIGFLYLRFEQ